MPGSNLKESLNTSQKHGKQTDWYQYARHLCNLCPNNQANQRKYAIAWSTQRAKKNQAN